MKAFVPGLLVKVIDSNPPEYGLIISLNHSGVLMWATVLCSSGTRLISLDYLEILK